MARGKSTATKNGGANLGFEEKLWQAADKMRGHMDPGEYKHVALGLIFLKYISDAFEARRSYISQEVARAGGPMFVKEPGARTLRDWIGQNLAGFFTQYRFQPALVAGKPWPQALATQILQQNDSIVSLNYSTLLEGLLDHYDVWSPRGGYSQLLRNDLLDTSTIPSNNSRKNISIYKIHGSEHFQQSEIFGTNGRIAIDYEFNAQIFPKCAQYSDFGSAASRGA